MKNEQDCMRCEETFVSEVASDYCPKCSCNMNRMDMGETKPAKEPGSASIIVELRNSRIIVRHGSSPKTILRSKKVTKGAWDFIWNAIEAVQ